MTTQTDRINGLTGALGIKAPVRVATTANITLSGEQTIDGVAVVALDRVLVKDQTDPVENGIYDASATAWSRSPDFDGARDVVNGTLVIVNEGNVAAEGVYKVSATNPVICGTSAITFTFQTPAALASLAASSGSSLIGYLPAGTGAVATTVQNKLREGKNVSIVDYGATDSADIATAFAAAMAAYPNGCTINIPATTNFWLLNSQLTISDSVPYIINGHGPKSVIKKNFNGDMISLGKRSLMNEVCLDGNGASYTGRGVVISTGANDTTSWRRIIGGEILGMQSYCIEYTAAIAGFMSTVFGTKLTVYNNATYAIKLPAAAETNGNRTFLDCIAFSGALIDLGGSQNTCVSMCQNGSTVANDAIKFSADTKKARIIGNRLTGGTDIEVLGTDNVVMSNIIAMNMSLGSGASQCVIEKNNYSCAVTDNSGNKNNLVSDAGFTVFTPTWTTSGTAPSLGNGTLNGNYTRKSREITLTIEFVAGSSTTFGTGGWSFSLPISCNSGRGSTGSHHILDSGTAWFEGWCAIMAGASTVVLQYPGAGGNITNTVPMTWAVGDTLTMQITYTI